MSFRRAAAALLALALLAGCAAPSTPSPTLTATIPAANLTLTAVLQSTVTATATLRPTRPPSLTPTATPSRTATPSPTLPLPVGLITPQPAGSAVISAANSDRLTLLALWGKGAFRALTYSQEGDLLAVGTARGVTLYDVGTHNPTQQFETDAGVVALSFAPGGWLLAVALDDNRFQLWQVNTSAPWLRTTVSGQTGLKTLAFSPRVDEQTGFTLASGDADAVHLWHIPASLTASNLEPNLARSIQGQKFRISCLAFSPNGIFLASGAGDGTIYVTNALLGVTEWVLVGHAGTVFTLAFSPDSKTLASSGADRKIRLWRAPKWEPMAEWIGHHEQAVGALLFLPDGAFLASGGDDGMLRIWSLAPAGQWQGVALKNTRNVAPPLAQENALGGRGGSLAVARQADGSLWLAAGSPDAPPLIWQISTLEGVISQQKIKSLEGYLSQVNALALSPDGKQLALGSFLTVQTRRLANGALTADLYGPTNWVSSLAFSPGSVLLAAGAGDGKVWLWQVKEQGYAALPPLEGHTHWVRAVAFSPEGKVLASGAQDGTVRLWRVAGLEVYPDRELAVKSPVMSLAFAPGGLLLAAGLVDGRIQVWNPVEGKTRYTLPVDTSGVYALAFLPDGQRLAAGGEDGRLSLWHLPTKTRVIQAHEGGILALALSPGGDLLAVAYGDEGKVALYDLTDPQNPVPLRQLWVHQAAVTGLAFSPDGRWLVTAAADGRLAVWGIR